MPWIEIDTEGSQAIVADFRDYPRRLTAAMVRAMNRGISAGRTVIVREMARDTGLAAGVIRDAIPLEEATVLNPRARIAASLERIPLIKFHAAGPRPSRGRGTGVRYRNPGGGRGHLPHAFIATMSSGHEGVFMRKPGQFMRANPRRQAIQERFGPSLGRVFAKFRSQAMARAQEMFETTLAHELERIGGPSA